jgi:hypothetical protein
MNNATLSLLEFKRILEVEVAHFLISEVIIPNDHSNQWLFSNFLQTVMVEGKA